jgi:hypothetical protein
MPEQHAPPAAAFAFFQVRLKRLHHAPNPVFLARSAD